MSLDFTDDDHSTLVQVMSWCRQATSHYLSQCWPSYLAPHGVTRPQWVNMQSSATSRPLSFASVHFWHLMACWSLCCGQEPPEGGEYFHHNIYRKAFVSFLVQYGQLDLIIISSLILMFYFQVTMMLGSSQKEKKHWRKEKAYSSRIMSSMLGTTACPHTWMFVS